MPANLTLSSLKTAVKSGEIDTVAVALVDMQGRLMGKRFHAQHFLDSHEETHSCNYLLATDYEMSTVPGYASASWDKGYGDYTMRPDLATLRRLPWAPGTALCMVDLLDHHTHQPVPHAPRSILARQVARAREMGFEPQMATELEFFLFEESYKQLFDTGYRPLTPSPRYNVDYAITETSEAETVLRALRNGLYGAGVPVECSKGEAERGQHEINARYSDALDTADMHVLIKMATKEIARQAGHAATFMAKYNHDKVGSSSHVHQSLFKGGKNAFADKKDPLGMSALMKSYVAGQLAHAGAITLFLAPNINSYKRFVTGTFAPTRTVWSVDNRTAGFRLCGEGTNAVRIECRIGGADLNPYLACAALLAAGLDGVEKQMDLGPPLTGDIYQSANAPQIPRTLGDAAEAALASDMLRDAFGEDVVRHYHRAALWEIEEQNRVVSDWEVARGFERA
ncbi:glutamine synthetase family protein [Paracoccus zhejiangensis]|uniref:Glutamine synthetase n=1 Tax=Paracoccus zhejiangensis TaxID=1077935 RepID=A0A2H5F1M9_9RHOB|nr:glutamine synthetase family protein [Paracoccus zhejiangensis]AUH65443.1 glutamine synthetase [Paracoccus zhejiangensis]